MDLRGFTLIEIMVVMGIFAILSGFGILNLLNLQTKSTFGTSVNNLIADIKDQQNKAIVGDTEGTGVYSELGIYFESDGYVLFRGLNYSPADPSNFAVELNPNITLSNNFPSSEIVFLKNSGEISNFTGGSNTITIQADSGEEKTITINKYGVLEII